MAEILISVAAKVAVCLVAPIVRPLGYLFNYRSNLDKLEEQVKRLGDARASLQHDVDEANRQGDDIEQDVQNWLTRADEIIQRARELIEDENAENTSRLCFNLKLRYQRSRQAKKQSGDIGKMQEENKFDRVSYRPPPKGISSPRLRDCEALESRASILNEIMEALRNEDIRMIGVWGMGGVGKTTLANQVAKKAEEDKLFEQVVMALNISQFPNVIKIQGEIASMLGLKFEEEEESGRAARLSKSLQKKVTVLVILDDIWEELSLENIGIPYGDAHRGCKVLLTSRNEGVLSRKMGTQKNFHVQHLCEEEAWSLFKKTAGDSVEVLEPIALQVVRECGGLPVAIVTVAKALKGQSEVVWNNALQELKNSAPANIEGVHDKVYKCLQLNYDNLKSEEVKRLFLLCGMLGYGDISMDQLLKYGMGLDLFEHVSSLEQIRNKLVTLVKFLKDSSLLLDVEDGDGYEDEWPGVFFGYDDENKPVRMHDIVGDVARAIAAKDPHRFVVIKEALGLEEWQRTEFRNCSRISLKCKDLHELPERLVCPKLEFFLLNSDDDSLRIPDTFFEKSELLRVLGLSKMKLTPLPSSLGFLSNLRTLCVQGCTLQDIAVIGELKKLQVLSFASCKIERLPKEFMQLTDLRALDLWDCSHLEVIPQNVISSLSRLEHLCFAKSFTKWGAEGFGSGESNNACLSELNNLFYLETLCIEIRDPNLLSKDLVFEKLTRYLISVSPVEKYVDYNRSARTLKLCSVNKSCLVDCFSKLFKTVEDLELSDLEDAKHVLYELHTGDFLHVKCLDIGNCPGIQYIVDSTKGVPSHFPSILEELHLSGLHNMDAVCYGPIPEGSFGKLRSLSVEDCTRLKSFISLPMEQGRDGSVLPEMGSLYSTRDFKTVDFLQLKRLVIRDCPGIQYIVDSTKGVPSHSVLPILKKLFIGGLKNMDAVCYGPIPEGSFGKLRSLTVDGCERLKSFISLPMEQGRDGSVLPEMGSLDSTRDFSSTGSSATQELSRSDVPTPFFNEQVAFPSLEDLDISNLDNVEKIWHNHEFIADSFGNLKRLSVRSCQQLRNVIPSNMLKRLQSLEILKIGESNLVEEVFDLESIDSKESHDIPSLQLRELCLDNLKNLKCVWNKAPQGLLTYHNLKSVQVSHCPSLKIPFPGYVVRSLLQVKEVDMNSRRVKEIVAHEDMAKVVSMFLFPEVTSLTYSCLKELKCFYLGLHNLEWPMLERLEVESYESLEMLASELDKPVEQPIFLCDKVAFPKLEYLNLSLKLKDLQPLFGAFSNLKILIIENCPFLSNVLSSNFVQSLSNLKKLTVKKCDLLEEVFDLNGLDDADNEHVEMLSKLEELSLIDLPMLRYICNSSPRQVSCFKNLELVRVKQCDSLMYLFSASMALGVMQLQDLCIEHCSTMKVIVMEDSNTDFRPQLFSCFQNLKFVQVKQCDSLMHLFSASMAFGLVQLKHLRIENCPMIEDIVIAENGATDKITFPQITQLSLLSLPNLTSFYLRTQNLGVLFNEEVAFPKLEFLYVTGLDNVKKIWQNQLFANSFSKLKEMKVENCNELQNILTSKNWLPSLESLTIDSCDELKVVFDLEVINVPEDVTDSQPSQLGLDDLQNIEHMCNKVLGKKLCLQNLKFLKVHNCGSLKMLFSLYTEPEGIKEIIRQGEGAEEIIDKIEFPELRSLSLESLPSLASFYPGSHTLRRLGLGDHDILTPVLFSEKVSFPNLEILKLSGLFKLGIWDRQLPLGSFCNLRILEVEKCPFLLHVVPKYLIASLQNLEKLNVEKCDQLQEVFDLEGLDNADDEHARMHSKLEELKLIDLPKLRYIWNKDLQQSLCFQNLELLHVKQCGSLTHLFSSGMALDLERLKDLCVEHCSMIKEIIMVEDRVADKIIFPQTTQLSLLSLPNLTSFYRGTRTHEKVHMEDCDILACVLFHEKVSFPNLEILKLCELSKLTEIWDRQLPLSSFCNLHILEVKKCPLLFNVVPNNLITSLQNLEKLNVEKCDQLKEVFDLEGLDHTDYENARMLSKLEELKLIDLPQLGHICNKDLRQISFFQNLRVLQLKQCDSLMYLFSASMALGLVQLDNLWVEHCSQIKEIIKVEDGVADKIIFRQTTQLSLLSLPKLTSFYQRTQTPGRLFNEEVSFPKLKSLNLSLTWKEIELKAFFNLRILIIENCPFLSRVLSSDSVQNLSNLKKLTVKKCDLLEEVFDLNGLDNADNEHVEMLSKLEELSLIDLPIMRYICNNSPRQVSCFQNLKLVRVKQCDSLMYLFSASMALGVMQLQDLCIEHCSTMKVIVMEDSNTDFRPQLFSCFQNLKFVQVKQCDSLMHLFSASMAFGLVQLKHLCIENCSMIEVIAPAEDGVTDSIVFPEITQLSLLSLPNLTSFYLRTQNLEVLFNEKVAFPNLEFLYVSGLDNVKKIWHNKLLSDSFSKLKETRVENCKELLNISSSNVMNWLPSLEFLTIASCGKLTEVFDLEVMNVQEDVRDNRLGRLVLDGLQNLEHICNKVLGKKLCLQNLRFLEVHNCGRVKRLFSPYTELEGVKEIIGQEEGAEEVTDKIEFPELTSLSLKSLPSLASFYPGSHTLKMVGPGDHDILITVLFHEKIAFPRLEDLDLSNLDNVKKIWHNHEFIADSFGNLKRLSVRSCQKLQNVIPSNVLKRLPSLQILKIVDCNSLEEVFDLESIDSEEHNDIPTLQLRELCLDNLKTLKCVWNKAPQGLLTYQNLKSIRVSHCPSLKTPFPGYVVRSLLQVKVDMNSHRVKEIVAHEDRAKGVSMFLFPEVTSLTNSCLKELKCFYLGLDNLEWPMLKRLEVESCESLEMLASELDKPVKQPIFLCDKVAFPNLEFLNLCLKLKEIQDLHVLFGALSNLKILIVENCPYLSSLFSPQFIRCLNNLKKLTVTNCDLLEELFDLKGLDHGDVEHVEMNFQIEEVSLIDLPMLRYICNNSPRQVLCFKNLKLLQVKRCQGMTYLFSPSMVLGLVQLQRLCIEHCDKMKEIVTAEEGVTDKIIFPQITRVSLLKLPNLTSFYPSQSLEKIHMGDSNSAPGVLFNEKVKFPELEILYVSGLDNVKKIWHHQLLADSFGQLKETRVENCEELLNISSSNVMNWLPSLEFLRIASCDKLTEVFDLEVMNIQEDVRDNRLGRLVLDDLQNLEHICNKVLGKKLCLQNLRFLEVHHCGRVKKLFSPYTELEGVKEIIRQEEGAEEVIDKIEFPELTSLSLKSLPSLASFYPGSHTLKMVGPGDHDILITVLFHEKVAFPKLEILYVCGLDNVKKIWHHQLLADSFGQLKETRVENCEELLNISSSNVMNWLPSLEFLRIASCDKLTEVFDLEVMNIQEDVRDNRLGQLVLDDLQNLEHICNKVLGKKLCLQNLRFLKVHNCGRMKKLFSPYTELKGVKEIIGQEEGAEEVIDKIEFPELISLSLKSLPSLASFYPGRVGPGDHGILITVLFDEMVAFPSLASLHISGLDNINEIWNNKRTANSFSRLEKVKVKDCNKLQNGLPLFVLKWLSSLQFLRIANCGNLKEVFDLEGANILDDATESQLNKLVLHGLPQLQYIWNRDPYGILTYENLDLVEVLRCLVLKGQFPSCLTRDLSQLEKQLIRSRWKKDLEGKDEGEDFVFPEVTYDKLLNLRKIKGKEVVVVSESDYVGEISEDMPGSSG